MTVQRVINSCLRYPRCLGTFTTIEFMVWIIVVISHIGPSSNSSRESFSMGMWYWL